MAEFNVKDCHALMNALVKQATGQQAITVVDSSSFVSAGQLVLSTGMESVFNSLNIVLGRLIVASRPYKAKLTLMDAENTGVYTNRLRKISFYAKDALASGAFNTNLFTNLAEGFTAGQNEDAEGAARSTKSQWEQHQQPSLEMNFGNSATWQDCITMYEVQVQQAFRNEAEFAQFIAGYLQEHANDIESQREAWNRMALLNKIASVYDMSTVMSGSVVNLTAGFNAKFGTSYTSEELRTTYLKDFLAYFVSEFKLTSKRMTERSKNFHWSPAKTVGGESYSLLRHTPYDRQRVYLFSDLFTEAESLVLPQIFNPEFLDINTQYEEVTYWQSETTAEDRAKIKVVPAVTDTETGLQKAGAEVSLDYVVGMITDTDGLMTNMQLDTTATTPLEARKLYRNTWNTFLKGVISDNTENAVIFIMADPVA
ncbi:MAG: hypothetical protein KBT06_01215 [Prevotellaceae bacterium]|nr:hypothetical protein [Candidatus Colivivens equi]